MPLGGAVQAAGRGFAGTPDRIPLDLQERLFLYYGIISKAIWLPVGA